MATQGRKPGYKHTDKVRERISRSQIWRRLVDIAEGRAFPHPAVIDWIEKYGEEVTKAISEDAVKELEKIALISEPKPAQLKAIEICGNKTLPNLQAIEQTITDDRPKTASEMTDDELAAMIEQGTKLHAVK